NPTPLDGLTQLYNRRHLLQRLDAELQRRFTEPTRPLSLVMIDIDHFKRLNDVHGHGTGDTILQALAPLAAIYAGPGGLAARHGGEEFALLLPGVDGPEAAARADMFRAEVAGHTFLLDGQTITFTVSAGVAQADDRTHTAESLLTQVDEKLYEAKRGGRNRVVR
ncbi:MAG: GGDEF domain-containing protein, partial [Myxococcales bacterium]